MLGKEGQLFFCLTAKNGEIVLTSEDISKRTVVGMGYCP